MSGDKRSCICPALVVPSGDSYVVRSPSPVAWDFSLPDFPTTGAWTEKDLSAIVPAGTVAVSMYYQIGSPNLGDVFAMRKAGNTNAINRMIQSMHELGIAGGYYEVVGTVAVNKDRAVDYFVDAGINRIWMVILGWWL